jgi:valyl-tRNA synthetase
MDRYVARKAVLADLAALGLVVSEKPHKMVVPRCGRTGEIVEPMLTDQWFVATTSPGRPRIRSFRASRSRRFASRQSTRRDCRVRGPGAGEHLRFVPDEWIATVPALDPQPPGLVHLAPAVVGPPDPGVVRRRGQRLCRARTKPMR